MAKLDIIVPHWHEDIHLMDQMFGILKLQRNVKWTDFRVLIVCDGEDVVLPEGFGSDMPFRVVSITVPHNGISAARNAGLKHSDAEWVMFCDSDDAFLSTTSLQIYMDHMKDDKVIVSSSFFEEAPNRKDGGMRLVWHNGKDYIFVHGKAFRRSWLMDNHIQFNDDVKLHEDAYFIALARYHASDKDTEFIRDPLYLWQWNKNSVTRKCTNFVLETYDQLLKKNSALADELLRRGMFLQAKGIIVRTITDAYCRLNSKSWNSVGMQDKIRDAEDCVAIFLHHYWYIYKGAGEGLINGCLNNLRDQLVKWGDFDVENTIPFDAWIEKLKY